MKTIAMITRAATPPTTPPAIAPVFVSDEDDGENDGDGDDDGVELEDEVLVVFEPKASANVGFDQLGVV